MHIFPGSNNDPKKCNVRSCRRLLKIEQINDNDYPKPELIAIPYKDGLGNFGASLAIMSGGWLLSLLDSKTTTNTGPI